MTTNNNPKRRLALKALGGSALAGGLADKLPAIWQKPLVQGSLLPAHAQTTSVQGQVQIAIHDTSTGAMVTSGTIVYTLDVDSNGQITRFRIPTGAITAQRPAIANALFPAAYAQHLVNFEVQEGISLTFTADGRERYGSVRIVFSLAGESPVTCTLIVGVELNANRRQISRMTGSLGDCIGRAYTIRPIIGPGSNFDDYFVIQTTMAPVPVDRSIFITVWEINADNLQLTIPITPSGTHAYNVDWGDGITDVHVYTDAAIHIYTEAGRYTVSISGTFAGIQLHDGTSPNPSAGQLREISQWGTDTKWISMQNTFREVENFSITATDRPDLSEVINCNNMFQDSGLTTPNLSNWDVSNVQSMENMFLDATAFNGNISGWDVSRVDDMQNMFSGATAFNNDISGWNVSSVIDIQAMFKDAVSFNQNIGNWDVSSVASMARMFEGATNFDQNIGGWNISNVIEMTDMFKGVTLSPENYDALLEGWERHTPLNNIPNFNGGDSITSSVNSNAYRARVSLETQHGWNILDGYGSVVEVGEIRLSSMLAFSAATEQLEDTLLRYEIRRTDGRITRVTFPIGHLSSAQTPYEMADSKIPLELIAPLDLDFSSGVTQSDQLQLTVGSNVCEDFMITVILFPDQSAIHRIDGSDMENCNVDDSLGGFTIQPDMDPDSGFGVLATTPAPTTPAPTTTR